MLWASNCFVFRYTDSLSPARTTCFDVSMRTGSCTENFSYDNIRAVTALLTHHGVDVRTCVSKVKYLLSRKEIVDIIIVL